MDYYYKYTKYKNKYNALKQSAGNNNELYNKLQAYLSKSSFYKILTNYFIDNGNMTEYVKKDFVSKTRVYIDYFENFVIENFSSHNLTKVLDKGVYAIIEAIYTKPENTISIDKIPITENTILPLDMNTYKIIKKGGGKFEKEDKKGFAPYDQSAKPQKDNKPMDKSITMLPKRIPKKKVVEERIKLYLINSSYYYIPDNVTRNPNIQILLKNTDSNVDYVHFNGKFDKSPINKNYVDMSKVSNDNYHLDRFLYKKNAEYCIEPLIKEAYSVVSNVFSNNEELESGDFNEFFNGKQIILIDGMNFYNRIFESGESFEFEDQGKFININSNTYGTYQKTHMIRVILRFLDERHTFDKYKFIITTQLLDDRLYGNRYVSNRSEYMIIYIPCELTMNLFVNETIIDTRKVLCKDLKFVDGINNINVKSELDDYVIIVLYKMLDSIYLNNKPYILSDDNYFWFDQPITQKFNFNRFVYTLKN